MSEKLRRQNPNDENKTNPAAETLNPGLTKEENNKNGLEDFGAKLDSQQFAETKLSAWMINENSGGTAGGFFHGTFYRLGFLLAGRIRAGHVSRKVVNTRCLAEVCFQGVEDLVLIVELTHANFAERQQIMRDEAPDKHGDSTENSCQQSACAHDEPGLPASETNCKPNLSIDREIRLCLAAPETDDAKKQGIVAERP